MSDTQERMSSSNENDIQASGRVPSSCRYCGTTYMACVDGDPCCKACLHADGHDAVSTSTASTACTNPNGHVRYERGGACWDCGA